MTKKKTFINRDNPALNFISAATRETVERGEEIPEGYKRNPEYIEKKTRRLQLVLQPSLYEKVKARADQSGTSVNEYIHSILEDATRG